MDGLDAPSEFPPGSLGSYLIDVDSKDASCGMACPPEPFVEVSHLEKIKVALNSSGILVINVSARSPQLLALVCSRVKEVFGYCFVTDRKEDEVNVVVVGSEMDLLASSPIDGGSGNCQDWFSRIAGWECAASNSDCRSELETGVCMFKRWKKKTRGGKKKKKK